MNSKLKAPAVRRNLKEKAVQMYEELFHGADPTIANARFWDDIFLVKPKMPALESEISRCTSEYLLSLKENINTLFIKCVECLGHDHQIRVVNSLLTLCSLVRGLYRKMQGDYVFDFINILVGFDAAEEQMQRLLEHCSIFITGDYSDMIKSLSLKFLLVLATGTDNISQNTVLEYLTINCNFEAIIQLLNQPQSRTIHGPECVLFLMLMVNYRKHEMTNPYTVQLALLDELSLNGYGQIITMSLSEFNRKYATHFADHPSGWFSSFTNMVGSMFISEEMQLRNEQIKSNDSFLLALYEAVHLNRSFITALTTALETTSPISTLERQASDSSTPESNAEISDRSVTPTPDCEPAESQPTNLLVTFLEYCSIVMQDTKTEDSLHNVKLCFIIITCISEDQYSNLLLHDANLVFSVPLHRVPMRHRKIITDKPVHARPFACAILDLMVEFIMSHLIMKKFPIELYLQSTAVIHRLLVYQKRNSIRLNYHWRELWSALILLAKFLVSGETHLIKKMNIFLLANQVTNIFNLFITYGDTFLSTPSSYDELYYEVMRMHQVFGDMHSMSLRYSRTEGEYKESAQSLTNSLGNLRAIISHFTPKLDNVSTLTEEQVLEVIRNNYESLTLKLHVSLDQYERYVEKAHLTTFFSSMVRGIISDTRQSIDFSSFETTAQELTHSL